MDALNLITSTIYNTIVTFSIWDLIDIILTSFLIYKAIKLVRETRAQQLLKGLILLAVSYFLASQFNLKTMEFILKNIFQIGIIALIVLFQPELRRALERVGRAKVADLPVFSGDSPDKLNSVWEKAINDIAVSVEELARTKTGALIVIERKIKLGEQIQTGVMLDAIVSKELIGNIFVVNTPLHDGAVIIRDGIIVAAACFLPKPQKEELIDKKLGSRHRAAIGISEVSDAVTIVVSEETGTISIASEGVLQRNFNKETLSKYLKSKLVQSKSSQSKSKGKSSKKGENHDTANRKSESTKTK